MHDIDLGSASVAAAAIVCLRGVVVVVSEAALSHCLVVPSLRVAPRGRCGRSDLCAEQDLSTTRLHVSGELQPPNAHSQLMQTPLQSPSAVALPASKEES